MKIEDFCLVKMVTEIEEQRHDEVTRNDRATESPRSLIT